MPLAGVGIERRSTTDERAVFRPIRSFCYLASQNDAVGIFGNLLKLARLDFVAGPACAAARVIDPAATVRIFVIR